MAFEIPNTSILPSSLYTTVATMIQNSLGGGIGLGFIETLSYGAAFALDPTVIAITGDSAQTPQPVYVVTANITSGNNQAVSLSSTLGLSNGMTVVGAGIPSGTTATFSGTTATLSKNATQTLTAVGLAFNATNDGNGCGDLNGSTAGGALAALIYNNPAA